MTQPNLDIVLVAVGGYGQRYVEALLDHQPKNNIRIVGAVDPFASGVKQYEAMQQQDILIVDTLDDFYAKRSAGLAIISSPIQFHCEQSITALEHGTHVLCEKPAAATLDETQRMAEAMDANERFLAIGYQASFDERTLALKARLMAGEFGKPLRAKAEVGWPRTDRYYQRASWAGRKSMPDGTPVNDSPLNNATAHFLHNLLFLLGNSTADASPVTKLEAECYRTKPIDNYDTALLRATTADGAEVLYFTSHSTDTTFGPWYAIECEDATIHCPPRGEQKGEMLIEYKDGRSETLDAPRHSCMNKLWDSIAAARENRTDLPCTIRTAMEHTRCVDAIANNVAICDVPESFIETKPEAEDDVYRFIPGLDDVFHRCYEANQLPSELGDVPWATKATSVSLSR